jgi:hypothetical protein
MDGNVTKVAPFVYVCSVCAYMRVGWAADVMRAHAGTRHILAVDVGRSDDIEDVDYGDAVSGWYVLWRTWWPWGPPVRVPTLAEIQSRLAYVSSVKQRDMVRTLPGALYLRPPVAAFETLDFHKWPAIVEVGYRYGCECVEAWRADGTLAELLGAGPRVGSGDSDDAMAVVGKGLGGGSSGSGSGSDGVALASEGLSPAPSGDVGPTPIPRTDRRHRRLSI